MSEKITINVGVFSIEPPLSDFSDEPIGLALHDDNEYPEISVLLARHGHHQSLYEAYLSTLPNEQSKMPLGYSDDYAVAAFGFLAKIKRIPVVCYRSDTDRPYCGRDQKRILAAKALYVALGSHTHIIQPDDNKMYTMRVSKDLLDTAIVQDSDDIIVV